MTTTRTTGLSGSSPSRRASFLTLWLLLAAPFVLVGRGTLYSSDEGGTFNTALSLVLHRSMAIAPGENVHPGPVGQHYACREILPSLACVPPCVFGIAIDRVLPGRPPPIAASAVKVGHAAGWPLWLTVSTIGPLLASLLVLVLARGLQADGVPTAWAWRLALLVGFSTPLLFYSKTIFSQMFEAVWLLLGCLAARRFHRTPSPVWAIGVGFCGGLGLMTRAAFAPVCLWWGLFLVWCVLTGGAAKLGARRLVLAIAGCVLPIVVGGLVTAAVNYLRWGNPLDFGYHNAKEAFDTPVWQGLFGMLFSPGKGLFVYAPMLLPLLLWLPAVWRHRQPEMALMLAIAATYLGIYCRWMDWYGGLGFGPRFLVGLIPLGVLCMGPLFREPPPRALQAVVMVSGMLGVLIQIVGVAVHPKWRGVHETDPFSLTAGHLLSQIGVFTRVGFHDMWLLSRSGRMSLVYVGLVVLLLMATYRVGVLITREMRGSAPSA